ncbi:MAG: hypothetical protein AAFU85_15265 [Planctomycetota bacterium]
MDANAQRLLEHYERLVGHDEGSPRRVGLGVTGKPEDAALSTVLSPQFPDDYYRQQCSLYFDTLASNRSDFLIPEYSEGVVRWEWPPWLLLTGKGKANMIALDILLKAYPTKVPIAEREFKVFNKQPFGRSRVTFYFGADGKDVVKIYEEFTFNDRGQMTFIEAWSDEDGLLPMPSKERDPWGEGDGVNRLSTAIPGLGSASSAIDRPALELAAKSDHRLAVFLKCDEHPLFEWTEHLADWLLGKQATQPTLVERMLRARGKR